MKQIKLFMGSAKIVEENTNDWLADRKTEKFKIISVESSIAGAGTSYYGNTTEFKTLVSILYDDDPVTIKDIAEKLK